MVFSGESTRIEDCSQVVFVAALSQEVPIKKKDENQSDDACSLSEVNRYVQGKASVTSTSYNTSHNGRNVQPARIKNGKRANSNNRARLEYRSNSEHSRMNCAAVGCSIIGVSDRQKEKENSRRNKPSDFGQQTDQSDQKGGGYDFASRPTAQWAVLRKELHMAGIIIENTHIAVVVQVLVNSTRTVVGSYFLV